jgi:alanine racemase
MPNILIEGTYTHLPFTNAEGFKWAQERTALFDELVHDLRNAGLEIPVTQARSSSGVLMGLQDNCNSVAPGSILYGKPSLDDGIVDMRHFKPVLMSVRSNLIHVSPTAPDKTPGMFGRYAFQVSGPTGVAPFGRRDGNRAALPGQNAFMLVRGVRCPVLAVSSEHTVLDLSDVPDAQVGDEVFIIGRNGDSEVTLADRARWQNTGMNDILLMMSGRMPQIINR